MHGPSERHPLRLIGLFASVGFLARRFVSTGPLSEVGMFELGAYVMKHEISLDGPSARATHTDSSTHRMPRNGRPRSAGQIFLADPYR